MKRKIEVRKNIEKGSYDLVEVIQRVLHRKSIGNFTPFFCRYGNEDFLVKSDDGDISDPFRFSELGFSSLYIVLKNE